MLKEFAVSNRGFLACVPANEMNAYSATGAGIRHATSGKNDLPCESSGLHVFRQGKEPVC